MTNIKSDFFGAICIANKITDKAGRRQLVRKEIMLLFLIGVLKTCNIVNLRFYINIYIHVYIQYTYIVGKYKIYLYEL